MDNSETQTTNSVEHSDSPEGSNELLTGHTDFQKINIFSKCRTWINLTIEPVFFALFFSVYICDIVTANLIMSRICLIDLGYNKSECDFLGSDTDEGKRMEDLVQPHASSIITSKSLIISILPGIMSLFLGPWSDYHGRKYLLTIPMLGMCLQFSVYAVYSYFQNLGAWCILIGPILFSFFGGYINLVSACYAYISDVSNEENRVIRLGVLECSFFIGTIIGSVSSSYIFNIYKKNGYLVIFCCGASISLLSFLYTMIFVAESIQRNRDSSDTKSPFRLEFLKEIVSASFKPRKNYGRTLICLCIFAMTTSIIAFEGESNLMYLFTRIRFKWDLKKYSTWFPVAVAISGAGLVIGCILFMQILKISDSALAGVSFLSKCIGSIFFCFIPSNEPNLMYWGQFICMLGALSSPALKSTLSKAVPKEDVGKVFFLATASESLFPLIFTPLYMKLYNSTSGFLPGAFFLLSALICFLNFVCCCILYSIRRRILRENYSKMAEESQ